MSNGKLLTHYSPAGTARPLQSMFLPIPWVTVLFYVHGHHACFSSGPVSTDDSTEESTGISIQVVQKDNAEMPFPQ